MSTEIKTLSKTEWAICRELALELVKMVPFYGTESGVILWNSI